MLYNNSRPFISAPDVTWLKRINWRWFLQRAPMVILAIPAAYGVGAFAAERLPVEIAFFAGLGFECCYMGAIAMADQQHDQEDTFSTVLWWLLNLMAVTSSIITNTLFFAGGKYADITPESITHGAPLALLAFMYGLTLHRSAMKQAAQAHDEATGQACRCPKCGKGFASDSAVNGHLRHCKEV